MVLRGLKERKRGEGETLNDEESDGRKAVALLRSAVRLTR
jgi:hypothetical protein